MGRAWDSWVPGPEVWRECLRVLKPGGHVLAFAGTRTVDLMALALRLAGFEIRDALAWHYGSGFPKSLDVSKVVDAHERGRLVARKIAYFMGDRGMTAADLAARAGLASASSVLDWTVGGHVPSDANWLRIKTALDIGSDEEAAYEREVLSFRPGADRRGDETVLGLGHSGAVAITAPATAAAREWSGWGTALKPSWEPIILARKPLAGTVAANVLEHGAGALNVNGCRVEAPTAGRWPPNAVLVHPPHCDGDRNGRGCVEGCPVGEMGRQSGESHMPAIVSDSGTAARFFYQAKASRAEREAGVGGELRAVADVTGRRPGSAGLKNPASGIGSMPRRNHHPTVKPVDLMRWLVRLVTPPGGTVLDPFTGSGTTGCACAVEGFGFIGIEREPEYADIARQRVAWWSEHGERAVEAQAARDATDAGDAATGQTRLFDW